MVCTSQLSKEQSHQLIVQGLPCADRWKLPMLDVNIDRAELKINRQLKGQKDFMFPVLSNLVYLFQQCTDSGSARHLLEKSNIT